MTKWVNFQSRAVKVIGVVTVISLSCCLITLLPERSENPNRGLSATSQMETAIANVMSSQETAVAQPSETQVTLPSSTALPAEDPSMSQELPEYQIVYQVPNYRYDGGKAIYVLVDQVDLSSDLFKDDIRNILRMIVSQEGNKISIEIHDSRATLDLSYKQFGDLSLGRLLTQSELDNRGIHLVATYDGDLTTNIYVNTLSFFPGAFTDNPNVGGYVDTIEFDASR
ncbi:MAG: hypothetical protein KIT07_06475 [Anaerolineales bacterium]|nr:hypothetical protein [Anaerolineales bacterium]